MRRRATSEVAVALVGAGSRTESVGWTMAGWVRHPELKVSTLAHTKHLGWYFDFEFRVTQGMTTTMTVRAPTPTRLAITLAMTTAAAVG